MKNKKEEKELTESINIFRSDVKELEPKKKNKNIDNNDNNHKQQQSHPTPTTANKQHHRTTFPEVSLVSLFLFFFFKCNIFFLNYL